MELMQKTIWLVELIYIGAARKGALAWIVENAMKMTPPRFLSRLLWIWE